MTSRQLRQRALFAAGLALSVSSSRVFAQNAATDSVAASRGGASRTLADSAPPATAPARRRSDDRETMVAPAVAIAMASKTFAVVRVPLPSNFGAGEGVRYAITPAAHGVVVGRRDGIIEPSHAPRTLLVTLGVASRMRAGDSPLARVRFVSGTEQVDVPIIVTVAPIHQIQITPVEQLGGIRAGSTFRLPYRLTNLGNGPDTVDVEVRAPSGWRSIESGPRLRAILGVNATVERVASLVTPLGSSGLARIQLIALSHGSPIASSDVMVEIVSDQKDVASAGPGLRLGTAAASGQGGSVSSAYIAELDGQLTDGIAVSGRASKLPALSTGTSYLFGRANIYDTPPSLALRGTTWHAGGGLVGANFSDLAGFSVGGIGISGGIDEGSWSASGIAAHPGIGLAGVDGELAGGRIDRKTGWGSATSTVTHLTETGSDAHQLDAMSVGGLVSDVLGGQVTGEIAGRRYQGGSGLGWSSAYQRRDETSSLVFHIAHAPGGAAAYARATDEFSASGNRALGRRLSMNAGSWHSSDQGTSSFTNLTMDGFTLGGRFLLADAVGVSLTGRQSTFDAETSTGAFGSGEQAADAALDVRAGAFFLMGTASRSIVERSTLSNGGDLLERRAPRTTFRGNIRTVGYAGALTLSGSYDETGAGIGGMLRQWGYSAQLDRLALVRTGKARVYGNAMLQQAGGMAGYKATTVVAGLTVETSTGSSLMLSAERNPFLLTASGARGWMYVAGVSHSLRLPRLSRTETQGVIYKDLNGNGSRDGGEPGFAGVVVRRGFDVAVTDVDGNFLFVGDTPQPLELDVRSLPLGWLAPSTIISRDARSVGVVAVSSVEIRFALDPADSARVSAGDLERVALVAVDTNGRAWVARRSSSTGAVFDALPPGTYSLTVDASETQEPLHIEGDLPVVRIVPGKVEAERVILLRPRALKFTTPSKPPTVSRSER